VNSQQQVLGAFIAQAASTEGPGQTIRLGRLDAVRDFVAIDDVLKLIVRLVEGRVSGELVNACSGEGHCIRDLVRLLVAMSKRDYTIEEQGDLAAPGCRDIVVGDSARFLALAGIAAPTSVRDALAKAWLRATMQRVTGQPTRVAVGDENATAD